MEVVIASSPVDVGIGCWDLRSGSEQLRYRSCSSASRGLFSIVGRYLASSQLRDSPSFASCPIFFWSWDKPQVEVRSFPAEPIGPLVSNSEGTYIMGGGPSGIIYQWEIWSLSEGLLLRSITFPSIIDAIVICPGEHVFYAGGRDGKIYI
ncbi:unnamed protein product, partial [Musa acuminata subsp. malaccensis]|uniref:(wild Malaysian banana) hypothetical protein n=2 Tax=Musa acuminata TaxID=4641 RepID=A0A804HN68_MUSAM